MAATDVALAPSEILRLDPSGADELLDRLEQTVPIRPPLLEIPAAAGEAAVVFGDSHGDWRSTEEVVRRYRAGDRCLIGLGDYIDRAPEDCGAGSVANALYLLGLAAESPERVFLIQGNHEMTRRIPVMPHDLPEELTALWGPSDRRYDRILGLLERGPIALYSSVGVYFAHAGFPQGPLASPWVAAFADPDTDGLAEIGWAECSASRTRRGAAPPWGRRELESFLAASGLRLFLRGHDPDLAGRPLFDGRCLTLHTCRVYERYGGVIVAHVPFRSPVRSLADVRIEHLPTEGRTFPIPT